LLASDFKFLCDLETGKVASRSSAPGSADAAPRSQLPPQPPGICKKGGNRTDQQEKLLLIRFSLR
jgi:hypothetical protein